MLLAECTFALFFVFQAEDGIRDLVRSRGLGDVYKRQTLARIDAARAPFETRAFAAAPILAATASKGTAKPVSYTHLTLPTSDLV